MTNADGPDLSRYDDWLRWLTEQGETDPDVLAIWVGGSAATGGYDQWSDLDLDIACTPGEHDATYQRMLDRALADFDVDHVWELPREAWPDGRQCFLNLAHRPGLLAESTRIIDLHLFSLSDGHTIDVRRHGTPIVVHDPDRLIVLRPDDPEQLATAIANGIDQVRQRRGTGEWLVNRAVERGHSAEAVDFYLRFALGPVVRLLRSEHCPWRHDFGLRYLDEDLPADVAERVVALLPEGDLREKSGLCFGWMDELLGAGAQRRE